MEATIGPSIVQFPTIEGLVREGNLEVKVTSALGLDSAIVVEVDLTSISVDTSEATGRIPSMEEADSETSTPTASRGSFLMSGGGEGTNGGACSSMSLVVATTQMVDQLRD